MKLTHEELFEEFYQQERNKYPGLPKDQFKIICTSPWEFLKQEIKSGALNTIRFKYFGVFQVYPGRAKAQLKKLDRLLEEGQMTEKRHKEVKVMLNRYLK